MTDRELSAVPFDMSSLEPAPIVLLVYNRPDHTRKTLTALSENFLADKSRLIVFADGPKKQASSNQLDLIRQTREVLVSKKWCKEVEIHEADENKGLARSVTDGVSSVVEKYGKAIILEDDILTSRGFLTFMNQALEFYEDVPEVMQIAGYFLPVKNRHELPSTFFYNVNSCWGWATWRRAWKEYREDAAQLLTDVEGSKSFSKRNFNKGQGDNFHQQLIDNVIALANTSFGQYRKNGSTVISHVEPIANIFAIAIHWQVFSGNRVADHLVRAYHHTYGLPVLVTNCSNNYGPSIDLST